MDLEMDDEGAQSQGYSSEDGYGHGYESDWDEAYQLGEKPLPQGDYGHVSQESDGIDEGKPPPKAANGKLVYTRFFSQHLIAIYPLTLSQRKTSFTDASISRDSSAGFYDEAIARAVSGVQQEEGNASNGSSSSSSDDDEDNDSSNPLLSEIERGEFVERLKAEPFVAQVIDNLSVEPLLKQLSKVCVPSLLLLPCVCCCALHVARDVPSMYVMYVVLGAVVWSPSLRNIFARNPNPTHRRDAHLS